MTDRDVSKTIDDIYLMLRDLPSPKWGALVLSCVQAMVMADSSDELMDATAMLDESNAATMMRWNEIIKDRQPLNSAVQ